MVLAANLTKTQHLDADCVTGTECGEVCIDPREVCRIKATGRAVSAALHVRTQLIKNIPGAATFQQVSGQAREVQAIATSNATAPDKILAIAALTLGIAATAYQVTRDRHRSGYEGSAEVARRVGEGMKKADLKGRSQVTFTVDNFGSSGTQLSDAMKADDDYGNHLVVPVKNSLDAPKVSGDDPTAKAASDAVFAGQNYFNTVAEGRNKLAEELAARAYNFAKDNPNLPINLVGSGAGGHVVQDAANILDKIDHNISRRVKVLAINTPEIGISDEIGVQKTVAGRNWLGLVPMRNKVTLDIDDDGSGTKFATSDYAKGLFRKNATESRFSRTGNTSNNDPWEASRNQGNRTNTSTPRPGMKQIVASCVCIQKTV